MEPSSKYALVVGERLAVMAERFWRKVEKTDGCWLWRGWTCVGYPAVLIPRHRQQLYVYGNVFSFFLKHGRWPAPGKIVCHSRDCPNRECVNPDHLYEGTHQTNALDYRACQRKAA